MWRPLSSNVFPFQVLCSGRNINWSANCVVQCSCQAQPASLQGLQGWQLFIFSPLTDNVTAFTSDSQPALCRTSNFQVQVFLAIVWWSLVPPRQNCPQTKWQDKCPVAAVQYIAMECRTVQFILCISWSARQGSGWCIAVVEGIELLLRQFSSNRSPLTWREQPPIGKILSIFI